MDRREEMLALRSKLLAERPEITRAYQLAPLMGEYERDYWEWQLDCGVMEELRTTVDVNLPPSFSVDEGSQTDER